MSWKLLWQCLSPYVWLRAGHKLQGEGVEGLRNFFFEDLVISGPPPNYLTKLGRPTPGVAQKKLVTHPQPKAVTRMWIGTLGNIGLPLQSESPKYLRDRNVIRGCEWG